MIGSVWRALHIVINLMPKMPVYSNILICPILKTEKLRNQLTHVGSVVGIQTQLFHPSVYALIESVLSYLFYKLSQGKTLSKIIF